MKKLFLFLTAALLLPGLCSCMGPGDDNRPFEPDTPAPPDHTGSFRSEHGSMRFNGNGKNVIIDFDATLAKLSGLPEGEQTATYVFLSGDLPPHGSMPIRYDVAHELQICVGETAVNLDLGIAAPDGSGAQSGLNTVTSERIPLLFSADSKFITVLFEKEPES
ncbi:MAG: hypothetical protein IIY70_05000 [Oscillospiraceae bacterium]|nr:hypothetical protein [Oscillospiraceae bacterium]